MNFLMLDEKRAMVEAGEEPIHHMLERLDIKSIKVKTPTSALIQTYVDYKYVYYVTYCRELRECSFL